MASGLLTGKYLDGTPEGSRATLAGYDWLAKELHRRAQERRRAGDEGGRRPARVLPRPARHRLVRRQPERVDGHHRRQPARAGRREPRRPRRARPARRRRARRARRPRRAGRAAADSRRRRPWTSPTSSGSSRTAPTRGWGPGPEYEWGGLYGGQIVRPGAPGRGGDRRRRLRPPQRPCLLHPGRRPLRAGALRGRPAPRRQVVLHPPRHRPAGGSARDPEPRGELHRRARSPSRSRRSPSSPFDGPDGLPDTSWTTIFDRRFVDGDRRARPCCGRGCASPPSSATTRSCRPAPSPTSPTTSRPTPSCARHPMGSWSKEATPRRRVHRQPRPHDLVPPPAAHRRVAPLRLLLPRVLQRPWSRHRARLHRRRHARGDRSPKRCCSASCDRSVLPPIRVRGRHLREPHRQHPPGRQADRR